MWPEPLHPGKSQLATDRLRNTGTDPLKKQLDPKGQKVYYKKNNQANSSNGFFLSFDVFSLRFHLLTKTRQNTVDFTIEYSSFD